MKGITTEALDDLVLRIHALPLQQDGWAPVVSRLGELLGASCGAVLTPAANGPRDFWCVPVRIDDAGLKVYARDMIQHDLWSRGATQRGRDKSGSVNSDNDIVDRREFLASTFFQDFLRLYDMDRFVNVSMLGPPGPGGPPHCVMSFYRGLGKPEFDASEVRALRHLSNHLTIAAANFWKVRQLDSHRAILSLALDAVAAACIVVDQSGRIRMANSDADAVLEEGLWLKRVRGQLLGGRGVAYDRVSIALRELLRGRGSSTLLECNGGIRQRLLITIPFSPSARMPAGMPAGAGMVWLLNCCVGPDTAEQLAQLFTLSVAETRVFRGLIEGRDLREIAEDSHVSIHTVRSQLKSVLHKTGRRSQVELMQLAARASALRWRM